MKINIIDSIFIEKGILHTYGRDGKFRKVFLRQGNLEGRCAVYSLMFDLATLRLYCLDSHGPCLVRLCGITLLT